MTLSVNLRHLEAHPVTLKGELPIKALDIDTCDEVIRLAGPLAYDLVVEAVEEGLLARGCLRLTLKCQCVRCLRPFDYVLELRDWTRHLALQGEEAVPVSNDCVDLTLPVREDILLEFPQHPLCDFECRGLPDSCGGKPGNTSSAGVMESGSPAWAELNKLKF